MRRTPLDTNSPEYQSSQIGGLAETAILKSAFEEVFQQFEMAAGPFYSRDLVLELGAGLITVKNKIPFAVTTDIRALPGIDYVVDATDTKFPDSSVDGVLAINLFHHLPDSQEFFTEMARILKPGKRLVLVEPSNTFFSRIIHRRIHQDEYFDLEESLDDSRIDGPLSGANQAKIHVYLSSQMRHGLPGELKLGRRILLRQTIRYVVSGGLNYRALIPERLFRIVRAFDLLVAPLTPVLALHEMFVFEKHRLNC